MRAIQVVLLMMLQSGCQWNTNPGSENDPTPGIALTLAAHRAESISDLRYELSFEIPAAVSDPVSGRAMVRFALKDTSEPLVLDFEPGADFIRSVSIGGRPSRFRAINGHIVIPTEELTAGENLVQIAFRAGDAALNRNADFMYTLFVPARAHLAFPCFDQPDLKARFILELTVPAEWQSIGNGAEVSRVLEPSGDRVHVHYSQTEPIPTYLFAFTAGKFQVESAQRNGRTYRMLHRETDSKKVERNRDVIFDLHAASLEWLQQYTAIPYRFGKFDFVLIPSFQFGGMEHPGSIFYNASSILLDASATENQMLGRVSLIAHETSHMWFGDLVTMRWFNDVWMKEVFANFMAAKIVNPSFPNVNHELRFLVSHYPAAYAVDRTAGTHPIRQELANLNEAGSLYGAIIYHKAPIVMRQLERILGPGRLREGLRIYLKKFEFGNATWLDLIRVLDERTDLDLAAWSRVWVEEAGRPSIRTEISDGRIAFVQSDPQQKRSLRWTQPMEVLVGTAGGIRSIPLEFRSDTLEVPNAHLLSQPEFVLPAGGGLAYGRFTLDTDSRAYLLEHLPELEDPVARGAAWITLWDEMLDRRVTPADFLRLVLEALPREDVEQNVQLILGYADSVFWKFLSDSNRRALAPQLEETLRLGLAHAKSSSMKSTYFSAFRSVVKTTRGVVFLARVWRRQEQIPGLTLAEPDEAAMALELAVRSVPESAAILEEQRQRFMNPDRKARFEFVIPALSNRQESRDAFFGSLSDVKNRRTEPWVLEGLRYLNHPLRAAQSQKYLGLALELLPEIRRTGDIFFPKNWMDAVLSGYNSTAAAEIVCAFLTEKTDLPVRLHQIVLQSADELFHAAGCTCPACG
jgi:aminopeptidase N